MSNWWITVEETQSGEDILERQMTDAEMNEEINESEQAYRFANEALHGEAGLDPEPCREFSHLAPIMVTYYRDKKDIGSVVCWSRYGFFLA